MTLALTFRPSLEVGGRCHLVSSVIFSSILFPCTEGKREIEGGAAYFAHALYLAVH